MADLMIIVLGLTVMVNGLGKLSAMRFSTGEPRETGLMLASILQTAGATMAMVCTTSGDFRVPITMVLMGIVVWGFADRRELKRESA